MVKKEGKQKHRAAPVIDSGPMPELKRVAGKEARSPDLEKEVGRFAGRGTTTWSAQAGSDGRRTTARASISLDVHNMLTNTSKNCRECSTPNEHPSAEMCA